MARVTSPCYGCKDVKAECKKTCEPFKKWDKEDKIERDRINAIKRAYNDADGIRIASMNRIKDVTSKMKGKTH